MPTRTLDALKRPDMNMIGPVWWHHHGMKMHVQEFHQDGKLLAIAGSAAVLKIRQEVRFTLEERLWLLEWEVRQSKFTGSTGSTHLTDNELALAFDLAQESVIIENHLLWIFGHGCQTARQGKFIRWEEYLNIPCPGTGRDGDPNVSIELDDTIKDCVRQLLR